MGDSLARIVNSADAFHRPVFLSFLLLLLLCTTAAAQRGFEVGVSAYPFGRVVGVHAVMPLFEAGGMQHAVRLGVSYAFTGLPGAAASYLLRDANPDVLVPYLGAGVGVAFAEEPVSSPLLSVHGLVGVSMPVGERLGAYTEVVLAGNALDTRLRVGAGLTMTFGGSR